MSALQELAGTSEAGSEAAAPRTQLQQRLAALDATAVEYAAGRDEMYAFVIDSERISVTRLGSLQEIATAAAGLYERVRNSESAPSTCNARQRNSRNWCLWPVAEQIKRKRVILIPDDSLHTVAFAVLPWSPEQNSELFVERAELSVMPSTRFVTHSRTPQATHVRTPRFELIGDPVFGTLEWTRECADGASSLGGSAPDPSSSIRRSLPRLPGSRKEVLTIANLAAPIFSIEPRKHTTRMRGHADSTASRSCDEP